MTVVNNPYIEFASNIARMRENAEGCHVDGTADQRVCVVCEQPVALAAGQQTHYVHADNATFYRHIGDHEAQPKLAHPMDQDPFAGC